ncbi:hypothetical protein AAHA92_00934 [Salvia divinorum]|uniref:Uncharacterized protein n=1 Tax=Salvia divinorum TaxID=28513 RepID=A0ABD1IL82_SALDI
MLSNSTPILGNVLHAQSSLYFTRYFEGQLSAISEIDSEDYKMVLQYSMISMTYAAAQAEQFPAQRDEPLPSAMPAAPLHSELMPLPRISLIASTHPSSSYCPLRCHCPDTAASTPPLLVFIQLHHDNLEVICQECISRKRIEKNDVNFVSLSLHPSSIEEAPNPNDVHALDSINHVAREQGDVEDISPS